ncbi:glycosyltransferase [Anaeromyxobacter dehalogenans]|uniref:Glycosyltransferase n=1 Tax=Anaeromyxobacter dehalogenans (strain 2CP-C) TaxID=290397 RepID=Q2IPD9_ANADE|nr:glycosyltransferase [Anaeromyxobacter dehalogenans 2CP-C]
MEWLSLVLLVGAAVGIAAVATQHLVLWRHVRQAPRVPLGTPGVSILKPLCGLEDGLAASLAAFAVLDWPDYEVVLGVRSEADAAWPVARWAARRWPGRFSVAVQRGEPGLNPKVNQLITLAAAARHEVLVVSDSNVRVERGYVREIVALLEDQTVGLVTHPIAGAGGETLGGLMDDLHLAGSITPGVLAAKRLAGRDIVVGKSMALRRADLRALGGFAAVKDVLAEDYVLGRMVGTVLRKRVAVAVRPIRNVGGRRSVGEFAARYRRWAVLQRQAVGRGVYAAQVLLNPVLLAALGAAVAPSSGTLAALGVAVAAKTGLDGAAARALRPGGFTLAQLAVVPLKDLVFGAAWLHGLLRRDVVWRGTRLRVGPGTRIDSADARAVPPPAVAGGAAIEERPPLADAVS